ncbi:hypothetical protein [Burkholderia lata]|uniref:hypothetical protein n=1 Tax=Burkholderia lata (strain ATCC 17760 / DSM 23089 / LMG 22485 / NCIMB 9086 / R18194 / 383) TaxID=482957 RepID=UPI00399AD21B
MDVFSHSLSKAIEIKRPTSDYSKKTIGKMLIAAKSHWDVVYENLKSLDVEEVVERFYRLNNGGPAIQRVAVRNVKEFPILKDDIFEYIASVAVRRELSKSLELLGQQDKLPPGKKKIFEFCKNFHAAANIRARRAERAINFYLLGFNAQCDSGAEAWFDGKSNKLSGGDKVEMLSADRMTDGEGGGFLDGLGVRNEGCAGVRDKLSGFISKKSLKEGWHVSSYLKKGERLPTHAMLELLDEAVDVGDISEGEYLRLSNEVGQLHTKSKHQSNER